MNNLYNQLENIKVQIKSPTISIPNEIEEIYKTINLNKLDLEYSLNFNGNITQNFYNIITYLFNNSYLDKFNVDNDIIKFIKTKNYDEFNDFLNTNGSILKRNLFLLANHIPKRLFNNNFFDRAIINEFVEIGLLDNILQKLNYKHRYNIKYDNLSINLTLYSYNKKIQDKRVKNLIKVIIFLGKIKSKTNKINIKIDLFFTDLKKKRTNNTKTLTSKEINSGFTISGIKLYVFRNEEIIKVLIHELIHFFELDKSNLFLPNINNLFNIPPKTTILLNEAFTEYNALLLNSFIVSHETNIPFKKIVSKELKFSLFQCAKILQIFNFKKSNDFFKKYDDTNKFKQTTSVFSYFIVKTYFLFKNLKYMAKKKNVLETIIDMSNDKEFKLEINKYIKFLENVNKKTLLYTSLRMTLFNL